MNGSFNAQVETFPEYLSRLCDAQLEEIATDYIRISEFGPEPARPNFARTQDQIRAECERRGKAEIVQRARASASRHDQLKGMFEKTPSFVGTELASPITEHVLLLVGSDGSSVHPSGTALFVAPRLAMTAKHVISHFWNTMGQEEVRFEGDKPLKGEFTVYAVQYPGPSADSSLWRVKRVWGARFTDVAFLEVEPVSEAAKDYRWPYTLQLSLAPPSRGERIFGFGYPQSGAEVVSAGEVRLHLRPSTTVGEVTEVFENYRDRGMLNFPCFEVNARFDSGMSGGPLFNGAGQVCGIICASLPAQEGHADVSYGASLWPAMGTIIDFEGPGLVCKGQYPVIELSAIGVLHSVGWDRIVNRIEIVMEPDGDEVLRLRPL